MDLQIQSKVLVRSLFVGQLEQLLPFIHVAHPAKHDLQEELIPSSQNPGRHEQVVKLEVFLVAASHVRQVKD